MDLLKVLTTLLILYVRLSCQNVVPSATPSVENKFPSVDYCQFQNSTYCGFTQTILGCKVPDATRGCSKMDLFNITNEKNYIVDVHNELRTRFANGVFSSFGKATKMKLISWDDELQYLAETQLLACTITKKKVCYATPSGEKSSANIGFKDLETDSPLNVLKDVLKDWSNDSKTDAMGRNENKYIFSLEYETLAYMIHEQVDKIGCAAGIFIQGDKKLGLICIYNKYLTDQNSQIYTTGEETCSACLSYGDDYKCRKSLCYVPPTMVEQINKETGEIEIDVTQTLLHKLGSNFTAVLIGGAIGITIITLAASYIKMRFFM